MLHARRRAALVLALLTALSIVALPRADAASSAPTGATIGTLTSALSAPAGTRPGALPTLIVLGGVAAPGDNARYDISVPVHLTGDTDPAYFTKDTTLDLTARTASGASVPLSRTTAVFPKNTADAVLVTSVTVPANQVSITVSLPGRKGGFTSAPSAAFDALRDLSLTPSTAETPFTQGIGGSGQCADATPTAPVCGVAMLPRGAFSDVLLSLGACDAAYAKCSSKGAVVQLLADLDGATSSLYSASSPLTILLRCDKTLCGGGAIKNTVVNGNLDGVGALGRLPACPSKGVVGSDQPNGCVDLVQSTRDNAGDTLMYVLLPGDARVSIG